MHMIDLNYFFLKFIFKMPSDHSFFLFRVWVVGFVSIPAAREYYEYISNDKQKVLGPYIWITNLTILAEFALFYKNYQGNFTEPTPKIIIFAWSSIIILISVIYIVLIRRNFK